MKDYPLYERKPFDTIREMIDLSTSNFGSREALVWEEKNQRKSVTFSHLKDEICGFGAQLIKNYASRSHIAVLGPNSHEWIVAHLAITYAGMVVVPFDRDMPIDEVLDQMARSDSVMMILSDEYADYEKPLTEAGFDVIFMHQMSAVWIADERACDWPKISKDTLATIVYTSGTTGKSKGVMLTHGNLASDTYGALMSVDLKGSTLLVLPLHHTFGLIATLYAGLYVGITIYINRSLKRLAADLKKCKPNHVFAVPQLVEALYKNIWAAIRESKKEKLIAILIKMSKMLRKLGIDVRRRLFASVLNALGGEIEFICSGGAPIDNEYLRGFADFGIKILNGYGITECSPVVAVNRNNYWVEGSVGKPLVINEVKINTDGEILVRGLNVMAGYYKDEAATAACLHDGWFNTGDLGRIDSEGVLYITGRKKNLIILPNGENISAEELEEKLARLPSVAEAVVFAKNNAIAAEIYPDPEVSGAKDQVRADVQKLNARLAQNKNISEVILRDEPFPKTTTRKIKRELHHNA